MLLCPCGSGKKVKFCCSDLIGDIEKIHRMIEGDQPRAALRHAEQTLAKYPGRASVLDLKATLELSLGEFDSARATIDEFTQGRSAEPLGLCLPGDVAGLDRRRQCRRHAAAKGARR